MKNQFAVCLLAISLGMSACQQVDKNRSEAEGDDVAVRRLSVEEEVTAAGLGALTQADMKKLAAKNKYVLVDYNAAWCGPCKKMMPVLEKVADDRKDSLLLVKVDADQNMELMQQKQINSIPYIELYKDGQLVWTYTGMISEEGLIADAGL